MNVDKETLLAALRNAKTASEWNAVCDEAKRYTLELPAEQRRGEYPDWWFGEVVTTGLASRKATKFKVSGDAT